MSVIQQKWNKYHEHLLKKWSQMSKTYSIMHSLCAHYYSNWHKRLGIPIVLLGGITASSIFSSNKEDFVGWVYINGGLTLVMTALAGVSNFLGTAERTTKHQNASYKYTKISMDIDTMLSFGRYERKQTPQEFIYGIKTEMLEIRENAPEVLAWVMGDFLNKFEKSLTNTNSKINRTDSIYIPIQLEPPELGLGSVSNNSDSSPEPSPQQPTNQDQSNLIQEQQPLPQLTKRSLPESERGELLTDFGDKNSVDIVSASSRLIMNQSDEDSD